MAPKVSVDFISRHLLSCVSGGGARSHLSHILCMGVSYNRNSADGTINLPQSNNRNTLPCSAEGIARIKTINAAKTPKYTPCFVQRNLKLDPVSVYTLSNATCHLWLPKLVFWDIIHSAKYRIQCANYIFVLKWRIVHLWFSYPYHLLFDLDGVS